MQMVGLIPARLASKRLPRKLLLPLGGVPLIVRTYRQAIKSGLEEVWVVADDEALCRAVERHGGKCLRLEGDFRNGTERCLAAFRRWQQERRWNGFVNIQGDEPFIDPKLIARIAEATASSKGVVTAAYPLPRAKAAEPSSVKVVCDAAGRALYFSRAPIPHGAAQYWGHIGIYGFSSEAARIIEQLPPAPIEQAENLEQLRWLYHGVPVHVVTTDHAAPSIDTMDDYHYALRIIETHEPRCA